ncbi:hypothetical protein MASR1M36_09010 [Candidatus Cloacimonadaceae bacterium]
MKIKTDITTLSRLYPLFEKAGIEGVLSGNLEQIKDLSYPDICAALLKAGDLAEICEIISGREVFEPEGEATPKPWAEVSREEALGVVVPFFIDITVGPLVLPEMSPEKLNPETSS